MEYSKQFKSLVSKMASQDNPNLKHIGVGNPNAYILFVDRDCNLDLSTSRGKGCYNMEYIHNAAQWERNIATGIKPKDVFNWVDDYGMFEEKYNPLYPYKGMKNVKAERLEDGSLKNGGASSRWLAYQALTEKVLHYPCPSAEIDFHQYTFLTVLSNHKCPVEGYSSETDKAVKDRCSKLLNTAFFQSFPVVIVAGGRMAKDYHIDLGNVFNQEYQDIEQDGKDWMRIYEKGSRLLIHTRPVELCSEVLLNKIASRVQQHLEQPLMKYLRYYDGTDKSCEKTLWAFYERHWLHGYIRTQNQDFQWEVKDMIHYGISEEWLDSFDIPRTLIGIFFNRYCHWLGLYDINDFMKWFEEVRSGEGVVLNDL